MSMKDAYDYAVTTFLDASVELTERPFTFYVDFPNGWHVSCNVDGGGMNGNRGASTYSDTSTFERLRSTDSAEVAIWYTTKDGRPMPWLRFERSGHCVAGYVQAWDVMEFLDSVAKWPRNRIGESNLGVFRDTRRKGYGRGG